MSQNSLVETLAAAILDGATLTFTPAESDGTALATGVVIGARLDRHGRIYHNSTEIGFGGLSLSTAAELTLAEALHATLAPVIHAALDDEDTGELLLDSLTPPQAHVPA